MNRPYGPDLYDLGPYLLDFWLDLYALGPIWSFNVVGPDKLYSGPTVGP